MADMRAALAEQYGGPEVVRIATLPRPEPQDGEILLRLRASTVSAADRRIRAADFPAGMRLAARAYFGFRAPRQPILGVEASGEVAAIGPGVKEVREGDKLIIYRGAKLRCHADFVAIKSSEAFVPLPDCLDFGQGAALSFGGATALYFLRDQARLERGHSVMIMGASGAVGSAAVQVAKAYGAEVTAICSAKNRQLVEALGADTVIAYDETPMEHWPRGIDTVFETVGATPQRALAKHVKRGGHLLLANASLPEMLDLRRLAKSEKIRTVAGTSGEHRHDLEELVGLAQRGRYAPLIGARFAFEDIRAAHELADTHHKIGSAVVEL